MGVCVRWQGLGFSSSDGYTESRLKVKACLTVMAIAANRSDVRLRFNYGTALRTPEITLPRWHSIVFTGVRPLRELLSLPKCSVCRLTVCSHVFFLWQAVSIGYMMWPCWYNVQDCGMLLIMAHVSKQPLYTSNPSFLVSLGAERLRLIKKSLVLNRNPLSINSLCTFRAKSIHASQYFQHIRGTTRLITNPAFILSSLRLK